jgi:hypothetical protein
MSKASAMKKAVIVCALILTFPCIAQAAAGQAKPSEDPLKLIPSDALFCVRINNLNAALGQIDLFLSGLWPMGVSMPVKAQLGQLLGNPEPNGLDLSGSFIVLGLARDANQPPTVAVLAPVSDYGKFTTNNPNVTLPDEQGISKITAHDEPAFSVTQVGGYVLAAVTDDDETLLSLKKSVTTPAVNLTSTLDAAELRNARDAPVWIYLNIPVIAKNYGPMIKGFIETAKTMAGKMQGQMPGGTSEAQVEMGFDLYAGMLDMLMNQTRFVSLSVSPNATAMRVRFVLGAVPDTELAQTFKGSPASFDPKMLGYLQNGAAMNIIGSFDPARLNKLNAMFLDLLGKNLSADDMAQIKKLTTDGYDVIGPAFVTSFSITPDKKPPFEARWVAAVKDPAKFNELIDRAAKMLNGGPIARLYDQMGMRVSFVLNRKTDTYKGVDIDSMKFTMTTTDANSPAGAAVNSIYGGEFNVQLAMTDGLVLYGMAQDPTPIVHELIDQIKAGGPTSVPSEVQAAMQLLPDVDKASFFATYNWLRLLAMGSAMMPVPIEPVTAPSQSDMAIDGACGDGKVWIDVAMPKQHLMEIIKAFTQMQQRSQPQIGGASTQ